MPFVPEFQPDFQPDSQSGFQPDLAPEIPPEIPLRLDGWHRLIPTRYSRPQTPADSQLAKSTVLAAIADDEQMLDDITLLDGASNERLRAERKGAIGISTHELVYGIPHAHIVNAAYAYTSSSGARFSDSTRGAWYAAEELQTSIDEVTYHRSRHLSDIIVPSLPDRKPDRDTAAYDDWQADFRATFHELNPPAKYADCLKAEPVPACYSPSQQLAHTLVRTGSNGLRYPSVRRPDHLCLACFRPALVYHPRLAASFNITLRNNGAKYEVSVSSTDRA